MKYTAAHWGSYQFEDGDSDLTPLADDPAPSRIGAGWVSASRNLDARILAPCVRKGWLEGDDGAGRCRDSFVEVSWDRALDLAAGEVDRIRQTHGNKAIFGGSYGWSSAGRFHHAQSQMRRFLALAGGFTSSRETYSHGAAEVLWPHVLGMSNGAFQRQMTTMPLVTRHCEVFLAFGGLAGRTGQVNAGGTSMHEIKPWLRAMKDAGVRLITISPELGAPDGEWVAIRPGTDTALIIALIHEVVAQGGADEEFLARCTSGWQELRAYVMDGGRGADWAAPICDVPAPQIRELAATLCAKRSMISMAWGLQRAEHGEQAIWAGLALAAVLGQIGQPGTGFGFGYGSISPVGRPSRLTNWPALPVPPNPVADYIPVARIADALLNPTGSYTYNGETRHYPDLRLVWWTGGNPFHHHQDLNRLEQAWTRPETVIVNDHSWTATARRADIVLPATTPLERDDLMLSPRDPAVFYMSAFHPPVGQARNDFEIFTGLAERLDLGEQFTEGRDAEAWLRHLWAQSGEVGRQLDFDVPSFEALRAGGRFDVLNARQDRIALADFVADPKAHPLGTESGRITLANQKIAAMALADCPGHPSWLPKVEGAPLDTGEFHLISAQPNSRLHAQNDAGDVSRSSKISGREPCKLHPAAAEKLGVEGGDVIKLWNDRGACLAGVQLEENMREDCISLATGAWFDPQDIGGERIDVHGNPNVLTLDKGCSALSQGTMAHSCVVCAARWDAPVPELSVTRPPVIARED